MVSHFKSTLTFTKAMEKAKSICLKSAIHFSSLNDQFSFFKCWMNIKNKLLKEEKPA